MSTKTDEWWIEMLIAELRVQGVRGDAIGDVVASVRELLRDSGQSAADAFGTPHDYAAALNLPRRPEPLWAGATPPMTIALVALVILVPALSRWLANEPVLVSGGQAAVLTVPVLVAAAMAWRRRSAPRSQRPLGMVSIAAAATASVLAAVLTPRDIADARLVLPALPIVIGAAVSLLAAAVWQHIATVRSVDGDPVRFPLGGAQRSDLRRTVVLSTAWLVPATAVIAVVVLTLRQS